MKIRIGFILLGVILLFVAYMCFQFSLPWLEFTPFPALTTINPLEPLAFILGGVGLVLLIFGFVENTIIRLLVCVTALALLIAFFKGWLNLDWLKNIPI